MKRSGHSKPRGRVVWDKENLDYLEATKSPKTKITEPKTPYHVLKEEDGLTSPFPDEEMTFLDNAVHAEAIRSALEASTSNGDGKTRQRGWASSEDETDEMEHDEEGYRGVARSMSFKEKRRQHYDEFWRLSLLRKKGGKLTPEEEEELKLHDNGNSHHDDEAHLVGDVEAMGLEDSSTSSSSMGNNGKGRQW